MSFRRKADSPRAPTRAGKVRAGILLALAAWGVTLGLTVLGVIEPYALKTLDVLFRLTPLPPASPQVVVVTVDQPDLEFFEELGHTWPWPRQLYAPLVQFCQRGGARGVIFDILFTSKSIYGDSDDAALARALSDSGRAVLPVFLTREEKKAAAGAREAAERAGLAIQGTPPPGLTEYRGLTPPLPVLAQAAAALGNVECRPDPDGIYRRLPLVSRYHGRYLPLLPFTAYVHFLAPEGWRFEAGDLVRGEYRVPLDQEGRLLLRFRGPSRSHKRLSAANVFLSEVRLQHGEKPFYHPQDLAGAWVLVGFTAPGLYDLKPSPLSPVYPGVELHATLLDNLLQGDFLHPAPLWLGALWGLLLALGVSLVVLFAPRLLHTLTALGLLLGLNVVLSAGAFRAGWWLDPAAPGLALGLAFALATAFSYATEGRQKQAIRRMFAQYMSDQVISHLLAHPERLKLGGERRRVTLFFSDLAGFTGISERLGPEELVALLNDYLSRMTDIILKEEGTVDKFEGDAIMAFWGAPLDQEDQALRAIRAALAQQRALGELNAELARQGLHPLGMRIGIHTGEAVVGNLGSQSRFDYTAIGDTVNLASRLEGLNKFYGTGILVSETTATECAGQVEFREVDRVAVKGRAGAVAVFEPLAWHGELTPELAELRDTFARGLACYREGRFAEAIGFFEEALQERPEDGPSRAMLSRCREFLSAPPPPEWDAVFRPDRK